MSPAPANCRNISQSSSTTTQQNLTALFSALLLAMKPAVALPAADLSVFLRSSLERTLSAQNEIQLAATVHLLGSTVNKRAPGTLYFRVFRYAFGCLRCLAQTWPTFSTLTSNPFTVRPSRGRRHQWHSDGQHYARTLGYAPSRGCHVTRRQQAESPFRGACRSQRASLSDQISAAMP